MLDPSTSLLFPSLAPLYQALAPWAEALLRAACGLALVPHGLRNTFGFFPTTGVRSHNLTELAAQLDHDGYRPGKLWAPAISLTQFIAGPLLALGLFTRVAAQYQSVAEAHPSRSLCNSVKGPSIANPVAPGTRASRDRESVVFKVMVDIFKPPYRVLNRCSMDLTSRC